MKKILLLVALVAAIIPVFFVIHKASGLENWQGVLPKGTTDSLYYYARIHEVLDGHPLNGNPYVYQYRDTFAPAFFIPDIVSSIPLLLAIPFDIAVVLNVFVWSFVFLILSFYLFQALKMPKWWAFLWTIILYASAYSFMLRPTVMQIVYPVFLVFLIALIKFLEEPLVRKRVLWLAIATSMTLYVYTFLAYIAILSIAFVFFWFLITRRFKELKFLIGAGALSILLLIPFGIYTWMQTNGPYYLETLIRIGLVYTHAPATEAYFYGRWIVVGIVAVILLSKQKVFWLSTGFALLVSLFLNVITGVEFQLAIHIGRFVILWMVIILGVLLYEWYSSLDLNTKKYKYVAIIIPLLVLTFGVGRNIPRGFDFFKFDNRGNDKVRDVQNYAGPMKWLQDNVREESVIYANDSVSQYIPIMTRHYPLFFQNAALHSISTEELEDRYLLSRSMGTLTSEDIKNDFDLYSGTINPASKSEEYFKSMEDRFKVIKKNQSAYLDQFNVKYIVIDRTNDKASVPLENIMYDDGRLVIGERSATGL